MCAVVAYVVVQADAAPSFEIENNRFVMDGAPFQIKVCLRFSSSHLSTMCLCDVRWLLILARLWWDAHTGGMHSLLSGAS